MKLNLSLVSGARSTVIAFPGRPGFTRNRFSPPQSSVTSSSVLRKPNANPEGEECATSCEPPSLRFTGPPPGSRHSSWGKLRHSHFRQVRRVSLPSESRRLQLLTVRGNPSRFPERAVWGSVFGDPREHAGFRSSLGDSESDVFPLFHSRRLSGKEKTHPSQFPADKDCEEQPGSDWAGRCPRSPLCCGGFFPGSLR